MDVFTGYENIMSALGLGTQKKFECWYDRYLKGRETMNLNMDGFSWDNAQIDFNYEFAEVTDNVTAMATYLDIYSQAVARGREIPMRKLGGYIPRQKRYETRDENDYRANMVEIQRISGAAQLMGESPYASIGDYLSKNLMEFAEDFPASHAQSITYQRGQFLSEFGLTLTDANNPNGIVGITFRANVPEENTHMGNYYTVDSETMAVTYDETKNPIEDYNKFLTALLFDGRYGAVEVEADEWSFLTFMGHPVIKKAIGYLAVQGLYTATTSKADADARALEAGANVYLVDGTNTKVMVDFFKRIFPKISNVKLHNNVVAVAKFNDSTKKFEYPLLKAFSEHIMLFRPSGNIGTIKNVAPIRPDASHVYARMFDGRGIMDYWYDPKTKTQHWESELTCLTVPNRPKKLHRFIMGKTVTATYTAVTNPTGSPKSKGYYEKTADGKYVLTTDTTVQESKTYYTKSYV